MQLVSPHTVTTLSRQSLISLNLLVFVAFFLLFVFLSFTFLSPLASAECWETYICGWSLVGVGPGSRGSAASLMTFDPIGKCAKG